MAGAMAIRNYAEENCHNFFMNKHLIAALDADIVCKLRFGRLWNDCDYEIAALCWGKAASQLDSPRLGEV
jgi:hypothetical protein